MTNHEESVSAVETPAVPVRMRLTPVRRPCGPSGSCPTVYQTERQTVVVQGYAVTGDEAGVELPDGELLVEIPADLLLEAADEIRRAA
jgi:hypothetical protein